MKTIRIKTLLLQEEKRNQKKSQNIEKIVKSPKSAEEAIERAMASRVPHLALEMDTNVIEINVNNDVYEALFYLFQLYGILLKPIDNGIEIDLREREANDPYY